MPKRWLWKLRVPKTWQWGQRLALRHSKVNGKSTKMGKMGAFIKQAG
jgi:hypothetical protein